MSERFTVALTGGIGSGKTTVAQNLAELGAAVLRADTVTHELYEPGCPGALALAREIGPDILDARGAVDRVRLGGRLFRDAAFRHRVEALIHPLVVAEIDRWLGRAVPESLPVVEVPLLYESGRAERFSRVVLVAVREEVQAARVRERHPDMSEDKVGRRIAAQMALADKIERADYVIDNSGTKRELAERCADVYKALVEDKRAWEARR